MIWQGLVIISQKSLNNKKMIKNSPLRTIFRLNIISCVGREFLRERQEFYHQWLAQFRLQFLS